MKKMLVGFVGFCLFSMAALAGDTVALKDGHPDTYTVKKGDTLWDISGEFLSKPWLWTDIWDVNPQIENPNLIFPGDIIKLVWRDDGPAGADGKPTRQPHLTIAQRGDASRTVKLSPQVRVDPLDSAIPAIPLEKIGAWLNRSRIVGLGELDKAPYVVSAEDSQIVAGAGTEVYVRGKLPEGETLFGFYRQGTTYHDPKTGELLGVQAMDIGSGRLKDAEGDVSTFSVNDSRGEVRIGDRALPFISEAVNAKFMPSHPAEGFSGTIIDGEKAVSHIGRYDVVILNKGKRDNLQVGNVLAVYNLGSTIKDFVSKESVKLPDTRAGLLMVFRVFDKTSYGIILTATQPMRVGDAVKTP